MHQITTQSPNLARHSDPNPALVYLCVTLLLVTVFRTTDAPAGDVLFHFQLGGFSNLCRSSH